MEQFINQYKHHSIKEDYINPMQKIYLTVFKNFVQSIILSQTQTDNWRVKLFYESPQKIWNIIHANHNVGTSKYNVETNKHDTNNKQQRISIDCIVNFINHKRSNYERLSEHEIKILTKYLNLQQLQQKEIFLQKLNPINNNLLASQQPLSLQQILIKFFLSIIEGYNKIHESRQKCIQYIDDIVSYFKRKQWGACLTIDGLKTFLYHVALYGRVTFNYLKTYIFAQQDHIHWNVLFRRTFIVKQQIPQLEQQQIQTNKQVPSLSSHSISQKQSNQKCENMKTPQKLNIQSVSDIVSLKFHAFTPNQDNPSMRSMKFSKRQIHVNEQPKYDKVLTQIDMIEVMLNKKKQKYLKNKQELQNQTNQIRRKHSVDKSSRIPTLADYKNLSLNNPCQQNRQKRQKPIQNKLHLQVRNYNKEAISQSSNICIVNSAIINTSSTSSSISTPRKSGCIKRRSLSKTILVEPTNNYTQYQCILKQIKRQQLSYKQLVDQREKFIKNKQNKARLTLDKTKQTKNKIYRTQDKQISEQYDSNIYVPKQNSKTYGQSRYQQIMNEIQTNNLTRSRVSSKKRQEIVIKATSQARLRIQEIQKRALSRITKIETQNNQNFTSKRKIITSVNVNNYNEPLQKYKSIRSSLENQCNQTSKYGQSRNKYAVDRLLNQRPSLTLSTQINSKRR